MEKTVFVMLEYELPHFITQKSHKYYSFTNFLLSIKLDFNFSDCLFIFDDFSMRKILQFGIVVAPLNHRSHKLAIISILLHIACNPVFNVSILMMNLNKLFVSKLALVKIKRLTFIIFDHFNVIKSYVFILLLQSLEILVELFLNFLQRAINRHILNHYAEVRYPQPSILVFNNPDPAFELYKQKPPQQKHQQSKT